MFCPKCGQQQTTDEMRFCSRCGFHLGVVAALIATGGAPPAIIITNDKGESKLSVNRSKRQGVKMMFFSGVISPFAMGFGILLDSPLPLMIPFTIFLAGLAWWLYHRWFGEEVSIVDQPSSPIHLEGAKQAFLSPAQTSFVAQTTNQSHRTAEIVRPPSITEHTTRLLESEENKTKN